LITHSQKSNDNEITPLRMKVTHLLKRQEKTPNGPPSLWIAGDNPRSKRSGERTSVAFTQGALVIQDTLNTRAIRKPITNHQLPRERIENTIRTYYVSHRTIIHVRVHFCTPDDALVV
jgi:hypothetical protein